MLEGTWLRLRCAVMVLVDTSVWVAHLRTGNIGLETLLNEGQVTCHPFIVGELACGNLKNGVEILSSLQAIPMASCAEHEEVMNFIVNLNYQAIKAYSLDIYHSFFL